MAAELVAVRLLASLDSSSGLAIAFHMGDGVVGVIFTEGVLSVEEHSQLGYSNAPRGATYPLRSIYPNLAN